MHERQFNFGWATRTQDYVMLIQEIELFFSEVRYISQKIELFFQRHFKLILEIDSFFRGTLY